MPPHAADSQEAVTGATVGPPTIYRTDRGTWVVQGWALRAGKSTRSIAADEFGELLTGFEREAIWSHSIAHPMVRAGEDIRRAPRRPVSSLVFPGNDYYVFDDRLVVFLTCTGNGLASDQLASTEPEVIKMCRESFEAVWPLALPHGDYQPV
ncbi:DUF6879 family protein [Streptomyces sp. NPDC050560]|uniref:DUF6879 family protein n=1 Tax=Streptomyces sp. NPDC050560 TaxID=3365630 RepID=UPI0037A630A1